jgi:hypothetical protein
VRIVFQLFVKPIKELIHFNVSVEGSSGKLTISQKKLLVNKIFYFKCAIVFGGEE